MEYKVIETTTAKEMTDTRSTWRPCAAASEGMKNG
jgi:hypothetical protein